MHLVNYPPASAVRHCKILKSGNFLACAYRATLDAGVQMLGVFTGGREDLYNYREQLLDAFPDVPFGPNLQLEYFKDANHTFDSEGDRIRLIDTIAQWVRQTGFTVATQDRDGNSVAGQEV